MDPGTDIQLKVVEPPTWESGTDYTESDASLPTDTSQTFGHSGPRADSVPKTDGKGDKIEEDDSPFQMETAFTGFFRDGERRIDLVLVIQDTGEKELEKIRIDFLMSALEIGLEMEVEYGVTVKHRNLVFIKVHAPDNLIIEYGHYFNVLKFFKGSHIEFVEHDEHKGYTKYLHYPGIELERQMIKLVRKQYPGPGNYSPLERSNIVYRILLWVPFGDADYVGLQCLLARKIVLDAYPLHDGPYYFLPQQDKSAPNARQVLYNEWVGFKNLLKSEPVHMIREYFGERVGFLFSFYDFYTRALFVAGIIGLLTFITGFFDESDAIIKNFVVSDTLKLKMCPKCRDFMTCPFRNLTTYTFEVYFKTFIDNPHAILYSIFIYIWAMLVVLIWRRKENYLSWLWEESQNASMGASRPEYRVCQSKDSNNWILCLWFVVSIIITVAFLFLYCLVILPVLIGLSYKMTKILRRLEGDMEILYMAIFSNVLVAILSALLIMNIEKVCKTVAYKCLCYMNHRTEDTYEKCLVVRWFGLSFINNFTVLFFYAFIKGTGYGYPNSVQRWDSSYGFGMITCGLISCIDELWVVYVFTAICIYLFQRIPNVSKKYVSDYNRGKSINQTVPCWEKEYSLIPINDEFIMQKYKDLLMQMALSTMFVSIFPPAPLFAYLKNIWDMRMCAKMLIMHCRRPFTTKTWGLGAWFIILHLLPFIISLCNSLSIALNYDFENYVNQKHFKSSSEFYENYMEHFKTADYKTRAQKEAFDNYIKNNPHDGKVDVCLFPARYHLTHGSYYASPIYMLSVWYKVLFIIVYQQITIIVAALLYYFIEANPDNVEETSALEDSVRNYAMRHEGDKKSK